MPLRGILSLLPLLFILLAPVLASFGAEKFPPPDFEPGTYTMPVTTAPAARAAWMDYLDVGLLVVCLSLAAYFVLVKRLRKWVFWLMVFSLFYFGFVRKGCICPIGSIQDVTLAIFNRGYAVPISVILFFLLPLVYTVFFGRGFCAGVCPLGAMQDIMLWRPVKVKPWLEHALGIIPYFYLGAAILFAATGSAFIICEYDPFVSFFRRGGSFTMLAIGGAFLIVGMFIGRPYCRFFCPYGAILRVLSRFSRWNVVLTPDDCVRCQICDVACPYGAIDQPSETPTPSPSRMRIGLLVLATIAMVAGGAFAGSKLAVPFSKMDRVISLAERVAGEETGKFKEPINETKAFRQTGRPAPELYAEASLKRKDYGTGGAWLGAFFGLVLGIKLLSLSLPEKRSIYEPDPAACVSCGRCYSYCPKELVRVKRMEKQKAAPTPPA